MSPLPPPMFSDAEYLEYLKLKRAWWNHSTGTIFMVILLVIIGGLCIFALPDIGDVRPLVTGLVIAIAAAVGAIRTRLRFQHLKQKFEP